MKTRNFLLHFFPLALSLFAVPLSCRRESDWQRQYGRKDMFNDNYALAGYANQFDAFWTAMNANYSLWDYEATFGVDWDASYAQFMPKFRDFDRMVEEGTGPALDTVQTLYRQLLFPLHDGHFAAKIRHLGTGSYFLISPSRERYGRRSEAVDEWDFSPDVSRCMGAAGSPLRLAEEPIVVETDFSRLAPRRLEEVTSWLDSAIFSMVASSPAEGSKDAFFLEGYKALRDSLEKDEAASCYNAWTSLFAYLEIPCLKPVPVTDSPIAMAYAHLDGGILYFYLDGFALSYYFSDQVAQGLLAQEGGAALVEEVRSCWLAWQTGIQRLSRQGTLRGVIVDVRGNGGGYLADFGYVLGSMLPGGNVTLGASRTKLGTGRLDYAPTTPFVMKVSAPEDCSWERTVVDKPIVVLCNSRSVSMAEMTALAAKYTPNCHVVGTRTWGGLCPLLTDPSAFSAAYSGCFGADDGAAPFYGYVPYTVLVTAQDGILEGVGVTPDVKVALDRNLWESTGRDTQLEAAVRLIQQTSL